MGMIKKEAEEVINISDIIITLWARRNKILLITILTIILITTYFAINNNSKTYVAITEIRPISSFEEFKYGTYNSYVSKTLNNFVNDASYLIPDSIQPSVVYQTDKMIFPIIDNTYLNNLFIEKLKENRIFIDAIRELNFLEKDNYQNDKDYEEEIKKIASSIKLIPPDDFRKKNAKELYWRISFKTKDKKKWEEFLKYIQEPTNDEIREYLVLAFEKMIINEKKLKNFLIEDMELKISNAIKNYDKTIARRLVFLKEQAQIARKLNIPKLTEITNMINKKTGNGYENLKDYNSRYEFFDYYKSGYEFIEEEIKLIENRKNKDAFIKGLNDLEVAKDLLTSNKNLERLNLLFQQTPISDGENFSAGKIMYLSTQYISNQLNNYKQILLLATILGILIGIFYVLIENSIKNNKKYSR